MYRPLRKFERIGEDLGIEVERITRQDYNRLLEFDALFIRETTALDHHTYRFAKKADSEDMPVIDDPVSIVRCANKIYLAELMAKNNIPTPKTLILNKRRIRRAEGDNPPEGRERLLAQGPPTAQVARVPSSPAPASPAPTPAPPAPVPPRALAARASPWPTAPAGPPPLDAPSPPAPPPPARDADPRGRCRGCSLVIAATGGEVDFFHGARTTAQRHLRALATGE